MFKCDKCNKIVPPNQSSHMVVVEKRDKTYHNVKKTKEHTREWDTKGWEIAKEMRVCDKCK